MLSGNLIRPGVIMRFGFGTALLSSLLAFLMIPPEAPIQQTAEVGYIQPR